MREASKVPIPKQKRRKSDVDEKVAGGPSRERIVGAMASGKTHRAHIYGPSGPIYLQSVNVASLFRYFHGSPVSRLQNMAVVDDVSHLPQEARDATSASR